MNVPKRVWFLYAPMIALSIAFWIVDGGLGFIVATIGMIVAITAAIAGRDR